MTGMALPAPDIATLGSFFLFSSLSASWMFVTCDEATPSFPRDYVALGEKDARQEGGITPSGFY